MMMIAALSLALLAAPGDPSEGPPAPTARSTSTSEQIESGEIAACQRLTSDLIGLEHEIVVVGTQRFFLEKSLVQTGGMAPSTEQREGIARLLEIVRAHSDRLEKSRDVLKASIWPLCNDVSFPAREYAELSSASHDD